ncbi:tyrosinase family oxidase copper chaperone [Streptomyces chryseus]
MGLSTRRSAATARGGSLTRRILLRGAFAMGVIAGTAGALAPILGKRAGAAPGTADGPAAAGTAKGPGAEPERYAERFAETYRGRHIQGTARGTRPARAARRAAVGDAMTVAAVRDVEVRIDGRPLHVMRRADGSYLSLVNHYESFPTLLDAARAAVDELGDAQLSMSPLHHL